MDRRLTPANDRVAAIELQGKVTAPRYVDGDIYRVTSPVADLLSTFGANQLDRQLLHGDRFRVLEIHNGHAFGQADRGGYVGYVASDDLGRWQEPTHWVCTHATFAFSEPNFKSPHPRFISYGCREVVVGQIGRFSALSDGSFIPRTHLQPLNNPATDPAAEAEKLIGVPYLWGGNSALGIDCSGLVQTACHTCNIACPGDSDLQATSLGYSVAQGTAPQRNDVLFWKGHVALVIDPETLLHANAHHMAVSYEPLLAAIARIKDQGDGHVTAHRRLKNP